MKTYNTLHDIHVAYNAIFHMIYLLLLGKM